MLENPEDNLNHAARPPFRMAPAESLAALGVAAGVVGLVLIRFENLNYISLAIVVTLFLLGIMLRQKWAFYALFGTLVFIKFAFTPIQRGQMSGIGDDDLLYTVIAICFAGLCFRHLELSKFIRTFHPTVTIGSKSTEQTGYQFPSLLGGRWWLIPVAVFTATGLLWIIPRDPYAARRYWITPEGTRLIFLISFLFFGWYLFRILISLVTRWRMRREQAEIQIRSLIAREFWHDQSSIEARRFKLRSRKNR